MTTGYPNHYSTSLYCEYLITMDPGNLINFVIDDFETEFHNNCSLDGFLIYDSEFANSNKLLLKHCGNHMPNQTKYTSTDNKMLVVFYSDASIGGRGFKANYSMVTKK